MGIYSPSQIIERRKERHMQDNDLCVIDDVQEKIRQAMGILTEAMDTSDGCMEEAYSVRWERLNDELGELIKLRGKVETR